MVAHSYMVKEAFKAKEILNAKGIGVDIDKDYCDIAIKRLEQEAKLIV